MSVDVRLRHDRLLREQAVEMFERGCGYGLTARRLGVSAETVREWQKTYRVIGRDGLVAMGVKQTRYDYETKVAAVRAVVDGGMSKPEAMVRFGIVSATPLKRWCRLYREGGAQALRPKPKGRPKGSVRAVPPTREEELAERVRKLEAQVAYLKKIDCPEGAEALPNRDKALGACQFFCVWGLEVGGDSVGVGGGELGEGLFPVGGGVSLDEAGVSCSFVGGFASVCEALGGSFVFDVADGEPQEFDGGFFAGEMPAVLGDFT